MPVIAHKHARPNYCVVSLLDHPHLQSLHLCPVMRLYSLQISSPELQQNRPEVTSYPPHFLELVHISNLHQSPFELYPKKQQQKQKEKDQTRNQTPTPRKARTANKEDQTTRPRSRKTKTEPNLPASSRLALPALLHSLPHPLGVLSAILLVQVAGLDICRGRRVGVIEQTTVHIIESAYTGLRLSIHHQIQNSPLYAGQDRSHIVRRAPPILKNIQAQLSRRIHVRMEHFRHKLDAGRLIGVLFLKVEHETEGAVFEGSVRRTNDDRIPETPRVSRHAHCRRTRQSGVGTR